MVVRKQQIPAEMVSSSYVLLVENEQQLLLQHLGRGF